MCLDGRTVECVDASVGKQGMCAMPDLLDVGRGNISFSDQTLLFLSLVTQCIASSHLE